MIHYPTTYTDNFGSEDSSFASDGMSLIIQLRNQTFVGQNFDSLELQVIEQTINTNFSFNEHHSLTDCSFKIRFPIKLKRNHEMLDGVLNVEVTLENSKHPITKAFQLALDNNIFDLQNGNETGLWFETQMVQLQKLLPKDIKINSCIFCAYSNYGVAGSDSFGTLHCFKGIKDKIIAVNNKSDYIDIATNNGISTQVTFWCSEFREIAKDQWQYKDPM
jgi:hypothetical protein